WLPGDRDIDLFVRFPTELNREELESFGLRVGHETLPDGREEYAEHPYVVGTFEGFDVDLVPCFDVPDATAIRSAVDRTPFHTEYLRARLDDDLAADVRIFKQFLTAIGAYGSDLTPPVRLDPEDHGTETFDDPLVVIDPTDPERNVAAVCSAENVARLQHHARALLAEPETDRFRPSEREPLSGQAVRDHVARRGTDPVAVVTEMPDLVDDQLYPQLRRSLAGIERELTERGFDTLRSATFATDSPEGDREGGQKSGDRRVVFLFELAHATLPQIERHEGPPVHVDGHAEGFYEKYAESDAYGPFLDGGRYVVERERDAHDAVAFLRSDGIHEVALGARVEDALQAGYDVLAGDEVADLTDEFGTELRDYFEPRV
ncbi:MAG: nucleotidyltransferase domain-containing protein, partial [Halobaculum sp.]